MPYIILYIEDESAIHELIGDVLKHPDLNIVPALTAKEGIRKAQTDMPDLIMLDVMMPDRSGWSLYEELREHDLFKEVPIIMLTGQLHRYRIEKQFASSQIDAYITKPFDARAVRVEVQNMLGAPLWDMVSGQAIEQTPQPKGSPSEPERTKDDPNN